MHHGTATALVQVVLVAFTSARALAINETPAVQQGHAAFQKWCAPYHAPGADKPGTIALGALRRVRRILRAEPRAETTDQQRIGPEWPPPDPQATPSRRFCAPQKKHTFSRYPLQPQTRVPGAPFATLPVRFRNVRVGLLIRRAQNALANTIYAGALAQIA
jgi:hypothetical protein